MPRSWVLGHWAGLSALGLVLTTAVYAQQPSSEPPRGQEGERPLPTEPYGTFIHPRAAERTKLSFVALQLRAAARTVPLHFSDRSIETTYMMAAQALRVPSEGSERVGKPETLTETLTAGHGQKCRTPTDTNQRKY